jgi:Thiol-activated cytolysin
MKHLLFLPIAFLAFQFADGQSSATGATRGGARAAAATPRKPLARTMKEYAKTGPGIQRSKTFAKNFGAGGIATKRISYPDHSAVNLRMERNPTYADRPTSITAKVRSDKDKKPEQSKDADGSTWNCTTDHVTLTATSTSFLNNDYSDQASHIYPGACYTFDNFYNGAYQEQTGARYPLMILTDNPNIKGSPYRTIQNPNMATIRAGLDDLFREAPNSTANESMSYQIYETSSSADQSLKISGGASGYGIKASGSYSNSSQDKTINLTIDATKILFTINTVPPDSGFFKDPKVENTPNLMVLGSVSYGVRVLANLSVTFSSEEEAIKFKASYSGWGVSANFGISDLSKSSSVNSTINCYVVGGAGNSTLSFDKKDLEKELTKIMATANYHNAMPVKYEFYDMSGAVIGSNSATDDFAVRECTPGQDNPRLDRVFVTFNTGNDDKNQNDNYVLYLYPGKVNQQLTPTSQTNFSDWFSAANNWLNYISSGSIYSYYSGYNSPDYYNNTNTTVEMFKTNRESSLDDFKNGGSLRLHMEPQNTDNWNVTQIQLTLNFSGSTEKAQVITFSGIPRIDNGGSGTSDVLLYFDSNFKQR